MDERVRILIALCFNFACGFIFAGLLGLGLVTPEQLIFGGGLYCLIVGILLFGQRILGGFIVSAVSLVAGLCLGTIASYFINKLFG